jgi:hypothetical protein
MHDHPIVLNLRQVELPKPESEKTKEITKLGIGKNS